MLRNLIHCFTECEPNTSIIFEIATLSYINAGQNNNNSNILLT